MMRNHKQLILFVKSPTLGLCKTRLIPLLGEQGATDFYKHLLSHCVHIASQLNDIDVALYVYPDTQHEFIQQLKNTYDMPLYTQQGDDLGERMHHAMHHSLTQYSQCVLIGSDCPAITTDYIQQAFNALNSHSICLGPATDGGYVLIGATEIYSELFAHTEWSTSTVLQQCLTNIDKLNVSHHLLTTLWDIDTPNDFIENQSTIEQLLNKPSLKDIK